MTDFDFKILKSSDGTWDAFCEDWKAQCEQVGDSFEDFAPDALPVLSGIIDGTMPVLGGAHQTEVGALWDHETKAYYAICVLHRALLPGSPGYTLRVRQLVVCPMLDYGQSPIEMYPDVVVGIVLGIIHASSTVLPADSIRLHLRSPEDHAFFRAFATSLTTTNTFASVQAHGSWLYIDKAGAGLAPVQEPE